jgi:SAM-dependent methyltransferase
METYTPGHSVNATDFMLRRTVESHGAFVLPHLRDGLDILDCGCGPGSITCSVAQRFPTARVTGVDLGESQIARAEVLAEGQGLRNVTFRAASAYALPFADASFDVVFSHALLEHLREPEKAIAEFRRVLRPGGKVAVCSPDWGGFLLSPDTPALARAIAAYTDLQRANGGDVFVGRKLGSLLLAAGFDAVEMSARYEVYPSTPVIAEYLALQLDRAGAGEHAAALREWSHAPAAMFAQAWVSGLGTRPGRRL